ncbi:hypothetical protein ACEPAF_547 [Sanghuangporus sanghuang]
MASIEEFESRLKEVVNAKRLSASRMEKLTELSMKLMENDTQLVSILYRTHKSLPASAKISSLYVFDALCRAARSQVVKRNLTGSIDAKKGNCATFLLKIDSVLDGLFQDVLSSGIPEAKEKTKKVLDIWTKSNTFPADVVTRLGTMGKTAFEGSGSGLKGAYYVSYFMSLSIFSEPKRVESAAAPTPVTDPRKQPTPPAITTTPPAASPTPPTAEAAQAALFALLTSANGVNSPSNVNQILAKAAKSQTTSHPPSQSHAQLGQLQVALLQQLSKNNNGVGASSFTGSPLQYQAPPTPIHPIASTSQFPAQSYSFAENTNFAGANFTSSAEREPYMYSGKASRDPRSSRFGDAVQGGSPSRQHPGDWHRGGYGRGSRGGFRGRGRGRGDFRGQYEHVRDPPPAWDRGSVGPYENDPPPNRRRFDDRSQSPPPRRRDNRSEYDSPPRPSTDQSRAMASGSLEAGKDEFGRDIRSGSEESNADPIEARSPAAESRQGVANFAVSRADFSERSSSDRDVVMPVVDSKDSNPDAVGLDSFDIGTFDPTSVESWRALGNAFQVTHGYVPSQEELMYLVMSSMGMMMNMATHQGMNGIGSEMNAAVGMEDSIPTAEFANGTAGQVGVSDWRVTTYTASMDDHRSDAVVLGHNTDDRPGKGTIDSTAAITSDSPTNDDTGDDPSGSTGRMQKMDDRWVFVRNEGQNGQNQ